jgi:alpha-tubulin suppressor-like RCC1 family protein
MKDTSKRLSSLLLMACMTISMVAVFPLAVSAADSTPPILVAGAWESFALKGDGTVWAWGYNVHGELGVGLNDHDPGTDHDYYSMPVKVVNLSDVIAISTFAHHSLALKSDGTVWAWGRGSYGELGDGTNKDHKSPVQVSGLSDVIAISAGGGHSLALKSDGTVWAWGHNIYGQLGDGTTTSRSTPVQVLTSEGVGLSGVIAISSGYDNCFVLKSDGTVWAWGDNTFWALGDGTRVQYRSTPVQVLTSEGVGLSGVIAISSGNDHCLVLKSDGTVWAWGRSEMGQLGDGMTTYGHSPVQVSGLSGVVAIVAGQFHSLALKGDGTVWAWGQNEYGRLGDGTTTDRSTPVQVSGLSGVVAIVAGQFHSLALKNDGTVWAWGYNHAGQLGDGTITLYAGRYTPVQVIGLILPVPSINTGTTNIPTTTSGEGGLGSNLIWVLIVLAIVVVGVVLAVLFVLRIKKKV